MEKNPYTIIIQPLITEKSGQISNLGHYTFLVHPEANKIEIAQAISHIFNVDVEKVRVMNGAAKFGRWARKRVQRQSAYKKAIVTLPPGQTIEAFEGV